MSGYAFAFAVWLRWCHDARFTFRGCDWSSPSVRLSWTYLNGPVVGMKVQQRTDPFAFGIVTEVVYSKLALIREWAVDITVEYDHRQISMGRSDFNQHWTVL
jgi:hypothetical protein